MDRSEHSSRGSSFGNRRSHLRSQNSIRQQFPTLFGGGAGRSSVPTVERLPSSRELPPRAPIAQPLHSRPPPLPRPIPISPTTHKATLERPSLLEEENEYPLSLRDSKQAPESSFYDYNSHRVYNHEDSIIEPMPAPPRAIATRYDESISSFDHSHRIYDDDNNNEEDYKSISEAALYSSGHSSAPATTIMKAPPLAMSGHNNNNDTTWIEIAAGVRERLRGARETWECIAQDFYVPTTCLCCGSASFCISDAKYVLCPTCKVVSPLGDGGDNPSSTSRDGVGLGFGYDDLRQCQQEILHDR